MVREHGILGMRKVVWVVGAGNMVAVETGRESLSFGVLMWRFCIGGREVLFKLENDS